jgi:MFS family permease/Fe-S cluster assembly iron-binding protein IscA
VTHAAHAQRLPFALVLRLFLPFAAGYYLSYAFRTVNAVAAPNLVADTGLSANALGFLTSTYMAAFAVLQLPLGIGLDRFGPRRVEAGLLLLAAAGSLVFSLAESLVGLSAGRALIGAGVSGCMMAAFKAFAMWFPPQRLPVVNAWLLVFGALGAISATVPVEWFLRLLDWRALFIGLAGFTLVVAASVFTVVPDHDEPPGHLTLGAQLGGLGHVFRDRFFQGLAPLAALSMGGSLAITGLWLGPWLRDVAGLDRAAVAGHLMIVTTAMGVGFLATGVITDRLTRAGLRAMTVAGIGMTGFVAVFAVLAAGATTGPSLGLVLAVFGLLTAVSSVAYSLLSQHFPRDYAGRANTALNVLVFASAFGVQWGIGAILGHWEDPQTGRYGAVGYRVGFGLVAGLLFLALAWFVRQWRRRADQGPALADGCGRGPTQARHMAIMESPHGRPGSAPMEDEQAPILTAAAVDRVRSIVDESGGTDLMLRVAAPDEGPWVFSLVAAAEENDIVLDFGLLSLVLDPDAHARLQGCEIDHLDGEQGERFVVRRLGEAGYG